MDRTESTTFAALIASLPDTRKPRGQRHPWSAIWTIICLALLSDQRTPHAIAHWALLRSDDLRSALLLDRPRLPSEATIRRALRQVDRPLLEERLALFTQTLPSRFSSPPAPPPPAPAPSPPASSPALPPAPPASPAPPCHPRLLGLAVDGKAVRGAGMHGPRPHLVSLVRHHDGCVLEQRAVATKRHESSAVRPLLAGRDLSECVVTMDAGLTHRPLAQQIIDQGGDYLMVVKRNRRTMYEELEAFFQRAPLPCEEPWREVVTVGKGHGRLETRVLTCTAELDGYVEWPGVQQVLRRMSERIVLKSGEVTRAVTYGLTSVRPRAAQPGEMEGLWRGHWGIENKVHYVRDVTMGEDAGQAWVGSTPQALAALRNGLLALLRCAGWRNIADALRTYAASVQAALQLLRTIPARL